MSLVIRVIEPAPISFDTEHEHVAARPASNGTDICCAKSNRKSLDMPAHTHTLGKLCIRKIYTHEFAYVSQSLCASVHASSGLASNKVESERSSRQPVYKVGYVNRKICSLLAMCRAYLWMLTSHAHGPNTGSDARDQRTYFRN